MYCHCLYRVGAKGGGEQGEGDEGGQRDQRRGWPWPWQSGSQQPGDQGCRGEVAARGQGETTSDLSDARGSRGRAMAAIHQLD